MLSGLTEYGDKGFSSRRCTTVFLFAVVVVVLQLESRLLSRAQGQARV